MVRVGPGLYGGVVRDLKDPNKKTISGKILNSIKQGFPVLIVRYLGRLLAAILIVIGHLLASETEKEILEILGVPWQEPHERVRADFI